MPINSIPIIEINRVCDYIPIVSTLSNISFILQGLFLKCILDKCIGCPKNRYWSFIRERPLFRCVILLIPILGNIYIFSRDYSQYKQRKAFIAYASKQRPLDLTFVPLEPSRSRDSEKMVRSGDIGMPPPPSLLFTTQTREGLPGVKTVSLSQRPRSGMEILFGRLNWSHLFSWNLSSHRDQDALEQNLAHKSSD